ncbi:MAG: methyltransferase [Oscillospiraceae bacterium]|nr:methyltransferase [Oscillospiraceae bacterium]
MELHCEPLTGGIYVYSSEEHRFGTDAFLLASFSGWRRKDIAADLGTGCGIIPMIMQRDNPPARVYGVEIQEQGIMQFRMGIEKSGLSEERVTPVLADLKVLWNGAPYGQCDLVTCNPPYKAYRAGIESSLTAQKIARHEILCNIYDVCEAAKKLLKFGGRLCICNRPERLADCMDAMRKSGIEPKRLRFVAKNPESAPWLFLLEGKKGSKPFMQVEPQLHIRTESGDCDEIRRLYEPFPREDGKR